MTRVASGGAAAGVAALAAVLAIAGCGAAKRHPPATVHTLTTTTPVARAGQKMFQAPGMALSFSFPPTFTLRLAKSRRLAGNTSQASQAAVGLGRFDLLIVSRFPHRRVRVTLSNVNRLRGQFDAAVSAALGHKVASTPVTLAGLPALAYPPAPVAGLPTRATSRVTNVFLGSDEYELTCQYTAAHAAAIKAACGEMLATLHVRHARR